jgi:hypothetical protein
METPSGMADKKAYIIHAIYTHSELVCDLMTPTLREGLQLLQSIAVNTGRRI